MIFKYEFLRRHPIVFRTATGLTVREFDTYMDPLIDQLALKDRERLEKRENRQRKVGGGRTHELSWRNQLLLTVVWLRLYPTYEVLGYFFGTSDSSAYRVVQRCLPILKDAGHQQIEKSKAHAKRKRGYSLEEIFDKVPGLAVAIDSFEQRIERPSNRKEADEFYSKKLKGHGLKSQVAVDLYTGEILDVAESFKGRRQDKGYFNESGVTDRLPDDTSYIGDSGYPGLDKDVDRGAIPRKKPRDGKRSEEDKIYNKMFSGIRIIVENSIGRMRVYESISQRDRHHRNWHYDRVISITGLTNFKIRERYVF